MPKGPSYKQLYLDSIKRIEALEAGKKPVTSVPMMGANTGTFGVKFIEDRPQKAVVSDEEKFAKILNAVTNQAINWAKSGKMQEKGHHYAVVYLFPWSKGFCGYGVKFVGSETPIRKTDIVKSYVTPDGVVHPAK